jgi:signal peptidase
MIRTLVGIAVVCFVLALVAPAASPIQISYVTSDSMEPTIGTDDGYILVPAGTVEAGDVITFYSAERGTYVTHRAISVTDDGIVTKGDANPSTDQASGYPPVQQSSVAGRVLSGGSGPLLIPSLGTGVSLLQTYWYAVLALLIGVILFTVGTASRRRARERVLRSRDVLLPAVIVAVLVGVALVSLAPVNETQTYRVTAADIGGDTTLTVGEQRTESLTVDLATTPVTHLVTETEGMRIVDSRPATDRLGPDAGDRGDGLDWIRQHLLESESLNITVTIPAQSTTGPYRTSLDVYPYPATLPRGIVTALHGVHPILAALSTLSIAIAPLYVLYWALVDTTAPLRSTRNRLLRRLGGS